MVKKVKKLCDKGQPVLVGTTSVEESEILSKMLKIAKVSHNVLNAKQHQREADIVSRAGQKGAITISTNMAGRGTDIKLGDGVKDLGGLFILLADGGQTTLIYFNLLPFFSSLFNL